MTLPRNKSCLAAALAALVALTCLALALAPAAGAKQRPLYWGAWIGDQFTGEEPPWDMSAVSQFESHVHKGLSLIEFSVPFSDCSKSPCANYEFPVEQMQNVRDYGAIPFLSWNSGSSGGNDLSGNQLAEINAGHYDAYIREFATAARDWGHPFFLRFNWGMNGNWFPWSEGVGGNESGEYVAAWRRVHDLFAAVGATNATWVWCAYADPQRQLEPIRPFYPGNAYVDWTSLDAFNWGKNEANPKPWRTFDQLFRGPYEEIVKKIAPTKPMLLAEMASGGGAKAKSRWIREMFEQIATRYKRIRGLIWFDQVDRGVQWPIETSTAASRAFSKGLRKHPYRGNVFGTLSGGPIPPPG
jgi:hypothetical protein